MLKNYWKVLKMIKRKNPNYDAANRVTVTATAQTVTNASWDNNPTIILSNIGTAWVYVHLGEGAVATTTKGYPIPPNTQQIITKGEHVQTLSAIASGVGSDLHIMVGNGV